MAIIKSVRGFSPTFQNDCWFADNATIIGDVQMGEFCTVWFNAVVRGDVNNITVGHHTNIQDGAVVHCTYLKAATTIGNYVSIGHNAIIHGCTIEDNVLIGMGAIVMDRAVIEEGAIVAAGAIVTQGKRVEKGAIYAGNPAKFLKNVSDEQREFNIRTANNYIKYASWFRELDSSEK